MNPEPEQVVDHFGGFVDGCLKVCCNGSILLVLENYTATVVCNIIKFKSDS